MIYIMEFQQAQKSDQSRITIQLNILIKADIIVSGMLHNSNVMLISIVRN